jgi:hypothetical protein
MAIFSKTAQTVFIKFQQFIKTRSLNKTAQVASPRKQRYAHSEPKLEMSVLWKLALPVRAERDGVVS